MINLKKFKNLRINKKYKKYLPSKRFGQVVGSIAGFAFVVFLIFGFGNSKEIFSKSKPTLISEDTTINSLLQSDTDGDGVYDWEEALWGTDRNKKSTFNDTPDAAYIAQKKEVLNIESGQNDKALNETEKFTREFFASYAALKSAGQDQEAINEFSKSVGEKVANSKLVNIYSDSDIKLTELDNIDTKKEYYTILQTSFDKSVASGLGDELDMVNKGLLSYTQGETTIDYSELRRIGQLYEDFALFIINTPVPKSYIDEHLNMANAAHNTGVAVLSMADVIDDPLVGLTGLNQYQTYSGYFIGAVDDLEASLLDDIDLVYGINENNADEVAEEDIADDTEINSDDTTEEEDLWEE